MTSTIKFVDANVFIERWSNPRARVLTDSLDREQHCTSVLVLVEVYHKLKKKGVRNAFEYIRAVMGTIKVYDITQDDLFTAMKQELDININDRIHIAVMKRNGISRIISVDSDFNEDKTILREDP